MLHLLSFSIVRPKMLDDVGRSGKSIGPWDHRSQFPENISKKEKKIIVEIWTKGEIQRENSTQ
jgi:hypothetical protein